MEIKNEELDTLKPVNFVTYNQLSEKTKDFADDVIWNCTFAKSDLIDVPIKNLLYPIFKNDLETNPNLGKIKRQFQGEKSYPGDIVENLRILLHWATGEEKQMMLKIIEEFDKNKAVYEQHVIICAVIMSGLKFDTKIKKLFEQNGVNVAMVQSILGVEEKYYGGLGAYEERWDNIKGTICPPLATQENLTPDSIIKYSLSSNNGQYILESMILMIKEKYGCSINLLELESNNQPKFL